MTSESPDTNDQTGGRSSFDLEERTARLGEEVIAFVKSIAFTPITEPLIKQLVRSAGSVGANYCEANDAESKRDFRHRLSICRKEAKETKHWLRMIAEADETAVPEARRLWQEAKELNLIFSAIIRKL